jgi:hypothetical protein
MAQLAKLAQSGHPGIERPWSARAKLLTHFFNVRMFSLKCVILVRAGSEFNYLQ